MTIISFSVLVRLNIHSKLKAKKKEGRKKNGGGREERKKGGRKE